MSRAKDVPPSNNAPYAKWYDNRDNPLSVPTPGPTRPWSIDDPICGCFGMHDIGINCCCAHTFGMQKETWTFALQLASVNAQGARRALGRAQAAQNAGGYYGRGPGGFYGGGYYGGGFAAFAQDEAVNEANRTRELLVTALNLPYSPPNPFLRTCCGPCFLCQEVDAVVDFYRANGYNAVYGDCLRCECNHIQHNGRNITIPRRLQAGDTWGIANPITIPKGAGGAYFYNGWLVPRDAQGSAPLRNKDLRSREQANVVTVSNKSVAPLLPLLTMDRV
jgi:hypothetical protein